MRTIYIYVFIFLVKLSLCAVEKKPTYTHRRYNEVAFAATHNGQSHLESEVHNQDIPLTEQMARGIRATKIHVWPDRDKDGTLVPFACHGVDRDLLYGITLEKVLEQVPALFRSSFKEELLKLGPMKELVFDALKSAYGHGDTLGTIPFRHCIFDPAARPLHGLLLDIKKFLDQHPQELFTLILEDHTKDLPLLAQLLQTTGLANYAHTQSVKESWPTLDEMIKNNKRLVIFIHGADTLDFSPYPWLHNLWDFAWDTSWDFLSVCDLKNGVKDEMPKRGHKAYEQRNSEPKNKLFVVYHFVTPLMGGSKAAAKKVNKHHFLKNRLDTLAKKAGHIPNIVQVDFFEYPDNDVFAVVKELNA